MHTTTDTDTKSSIPYPMPLACAAREQPTVRVPLNGKNAEGRCMVLDAPDWAMVRETWGAGWYVLLGGQSRYVASGRNTVKTLAAQPRGGVALLHRLLTGARPGEVVVFQDGDTFNLRRSNLVVLDEHEAAGWRRAKVEAARIAAGAAH